MIKDLKKVDSQSLGLQAEIYNFLKENQLDYSSEARIIKGAFDNMYNKLNLLKKDSPSKINLNFYTSDINIISSVLNSLNDKHQFNNNQKEEIVVFLYKLTEFSKKLKDYLTKLSTDSKKLKDEIDKKALKSGLNQ